MKNRFNRARSALLGPSDEVACAFTVLKDPTRMHWTGGTLYPVINAADVLCEAVVIHTAERRAFEA